MIRHRVVVSAVVALILASGASAAGEEASRPELGRWWEQSSLTYDPVPDRWLFYGDGTYSLALKSGNIEQESHKLQATAFVRKRRFTTFLGATIDKDTEDNVPAGTHKSHDTRGVETSLYYDLTLRLVPQVGAIWERDTTIEVDSRETLYAGLGVRWPTTERLAVRSVLAAGWQRERFSPKVQEFLDFSSEEVAGAFVRSDYRFGIAPGIAWSGRIQVLQNFTRSPVFELGDDGAIVVGETRRTRTLFGNTLEVALSERFAFVTKYVIEHDDNPWPTVLKTDRRLSSGLKVSFFSK